MSGNPIRDVEKLISCLNRKTLGEAVRQAQRQSSSSRRKPEEHFVPGVSAYFQQSNTSLRARDAPT